MQGRGWRQEAPQTPASMHHDLHGSSRYGMLRNNVKVHKADTLQVQVYITWYRHQEPMWLMQYVSLSTLFQG